MKGMMQAKRKGFNRVNWLKSRCKQQKYLCALCGMPMHKDHRAMVPTCDHIIPLSKGGEDHYENIQAVHLHCNQSKGADLPPTNKNP